MARVSMRRIQMHRVARGLTRTLDEHIEPVQRTLDRLLMGTSVTRAGELSRLFEDPQPPYAWADPHTGAHRADRQICVVSATWVTVEVLGVMHRPARRMLDRFDD